MTVGRTAFASVAVAVRITAFPVALTQHGRKLRGKAPSCFATTGLAEPVLLAARRIHDDVAAHDEAIERLTHQHFVNRCESHDAFERRCAGESLALEPVEQLEQLIFTRDLAPGISA